jgi:hypothetical protein
LAASFSVPSGSPSGAREIATRLLAVAERFCSDAVPEIRTAIEWDRATEAT